MIKLLRLLVLLGILNNYWVAAVAQTDSGHLQISVLTCQPGEDLYSTFGHSALRVTDSASNDDIVYNYGTFDFSEPGFYIKFIRGKLLYYLSTENFDSFQLFYQQQNRGISEQVLQLTLAEKKNIIRLLQQNLESGNRFYKYDFTFDNCTTRLRDLVEKTADASVVYQNVLTQPKKFRQLIYEYLDNGDKQWSKLGIDLLLGSKLDAIMTTRQAMFLPDYLQKTLDVTKIGGTPVVHSTRNVHAVYVQPATHKNIIVQPEFIFSVFFLLIAALSFSKNKAVQKVIYNFDGLLFFLVGLLGVLILLMWFGTDHIMCKNNFNLLWAWPLHTIAALYTRGRTPFIKNYFKLTALINFIVLISWFFLPQHLNVSLIPVVMLLMVRSTIIGFDFKKL